MNIVLHDSEYLNFVEFNITGDNDNYNRCDPESKYLDTEVFNLFQNCFENASKTYDYFAGTRYNSRTIIVLRNELGSVLENFKQISSLEAFINLVESRFMGKDFLLSLAENDRFWNRNWQDYNDLIIKVLTDLIDLVERCAFEERILWVVGY
ncbi:MAG: hypothetical protein JXB19_02720 [Bacteroidales bacterium]|nr:hypothetical protein [Bacteroidales bacterium]